MVVLKYSTETWSFLTPRKCKVYSNEMLLFILLYNTEDPSSKTNTVDSHLWYLCSIKLLQTLTELTNTEPLLLGGLQGLLQVSGHMSSTHQYITLFYVCFCIKIALQHYAWESFLTSKLPTKSTKT